MTERPEEPPGPRAVEEFVRTLQDIDGVDTRVAAILQRLHAEGRLNASTIVSVLRQARNGWLEDHDGQDQAPQG